MAAGVLFLPSAALALPRLGRSSRLLLVPRRARPAGPSVHVSDPRGLRAARPPASSTFERRAGTAGSCGWCSAVLRVRCWWRQFGSDSAQVALSSACFSWELQSGCFPGDLRFIGYMFCCVRDELLCVGVFFYVGKELLGVSYYWRGGRSMMLNESDTGRNDTVVFQGQLEELFNNLKTMVDRGQKQDALYILQANYEIAKEQVDDGLKGIEQAAILDILSLGYMLVGDFKIVEHLLELLMEIVSALKDEQTLLDSILVHMGSMYLTMRKFEDAAITYDRCLKIIEKEFGQDSLFLITPLLGRAKVFKLIGRATKAMAIYDQAIYILEKNRGMDSDELVIPLFCLGDLCISEGKALEAESCFSRILSIYKKIYGETDGRVGIAMSSLAHAMCAKGNVEEAVTLYRSGLQVIYDSNYLNLDDEFLEKMRIDLAELLHAIGRAQEGREILQECILISEKYNGLEHPNTVNHILNLATSYFQSKDFGEAEHLLRRCLQIMAKTKEKDDQSISVPMLHLAVTLYHLKDDEEAEKLALEVVRTREKAFGKESLPVGEALDCLVSIQSRLGKNDGNILATLKRILSIQENELGRETEELLTTLKKIIFYVDKIGLKDEKPPLQRRLQLLNAKFKQRAPV
ncbi:hypothetical protein AXF42_Ash000233 [Apostasia shenzhenica]|uniref:Nephrocystin-3 n=1 Tax=Apostasia shenzhenica TaxID=1088818 RepID=A0A2I0AFS6_9ASPA|nr:hypothetical protein AXF42_Ash000233 [Apostasia shenzhenica]